MGVSKVEFGGDTLIDLTEDSVTPETMTKGTTAHNSAGEPIEGTFDPDIYQTKTDDSLETESKEVVGAINEVNEKALVNADNILLSNVSIVSYEGAVDGIVYDGTFWAYTGEFEKDILEIPTTVRIPIVEGENVTFEVDNKNQVVKINATGGGSSGFKMPQIRFANFQDTQGTMRLYEGNPFTFTVEIVGGGELKEGDLLQICVRRKYWYKDKEKHKWKLRMVVQREITDEDIGKRFLSINVTLGNVEPRGNWLFRNDRNAQRSDGTIDTHSYMYFRIKRVTQYCGGEECNAIFSNVEKVAKTYYPHSKLLTIK